MNKFYITKSAEPILVSDDSADILISGGCPLMFPSSMSFQHHVLMVEIDDGSDKFHKAYESHDGEECC